MHAIRRAMAAAAASYLGRNDATSWCCENESNRDTRYLDVMGPWQYRLRALGRGKTLGAGWNVREEWTMSVAMRSDRRPHKQWVGRLVGVAMAACAASPALADSGKIPDLSSSTSEAWTPLARDG